MTVENEEEAETKKEQRKILGFLFVFIQLGGPSRMRGENWCILNVKFAYKMRNAIEIGNSEKCPDNRIEAKWCSWAIDSLWFRNKLKIRFILFFFFFWLDARSRRIKGKKEEHSRDYPLANEYLLSASDISIKDRVKVEFLWCAEKKT